MTNIRSYQASYLDGQHIRRKIWMIMRLIILLLLVSTMTISAKSYSQKVNITATDVSVENVLRQIREQTGSSILWGNQALQNLPIISVSLKKASLEKALKTSLKDLPLSYEVHGNVVYIERKQTLLTEVKLEEFSEGGTLQLQEITGTVKDSVTGEPLAGVTIRVQGTTTGTVTDGSGRFSLEAEDDAILEVSFVGYSSKTISVNGKSSIEILLLSSATGLDQLVVIGYGTAKKKDISGAITSVDGSTLRNSPSVNVASSLQGLMPGVTSLQSSGEPGRNEPGISIRGLATTGNNNPLVVVNGVPTTGNEWEYINSDDIKSISVLKDASGAIYGSRAANGVILITTRRGVSGKPTVSYSFNEGLTVPTMIPTPASSYNYAQYVNQLAERDNQPPIFTADEIEKFRTGNDPVNYPNVNWYDIAIKKVVSQNKQNLNFRGGNDNIRYSISGSYSNENSLFKGGSLNFKTYGIRSNLDASINNNIKIGVDLNANANNGNYPNYNVGTVMHSLLAQQPWQPAIWPNGLPTPGLERGENPLFMVSDASGNINNLDKNFLGKVSVNIDIPGVKGLSVAGFFAYTDNNNTVKNWKTPWTVYDYDKATDEYIPRLGGGVLLPQLTQSFDNLTDKLLNLRIEYQRILGKNSLEFFIGAEQDEIISSNFSGSRIDFISPTIDELFAGSLDNQQATGSKAVNGRQSLFGRFSYGFSDKYLMNLNFRYDGSSIFSKGKRFGFFPGGSVAWRISRENFLKDMNFINDLKIRGSYGEIGNDRIAAFQYLSLYTFTGGEIFGNPPSVSQGLSIGVDPNPNVTWEVARLTDLGFDATLWNGLLNVTFDWFLQRRSNILTTRSAAIPVFSNLSLPSENIGKTENRGIELELGTQRKIKDWYFGFNVNFSTNKSKIINISEPTNIPEWQKKEGHVIGATSYYRAIDIFRTEDELGNDPVFSGTKVGDIKYEDIDGDGVITANDMIVLDKTRNPRITYGFNFNIGYNRFTLFANFAGYSKVWSQYHFYARNSQNSLADVIDNRYVPGSMDSKYPILPTIEGSASSEVSGLQSDFWLYNTSYLRLKTIQLSYDLPRNFLSKFNINSLKVFVSGDNVATFSRFKLFDPANTNVNGFYYPLMSIYNIGLNVQF